MKTYTENHYGDYRPANQSNSLRACGATCGGGSEVLVLESNQNHARAMDTEICPTLPASMGLGGGYVPMIVEYCVNDDPTPKVNGGACATHFPERDTSLLL